MKTRLFTAIVTRDEMRDILQRARLAEVLAARAALAARLATKKMEAARDRLLTIDEVTVTTAADPAAFELALQLVIQHRAGLV